MIKFQDDGIIYVKKRLCEDCYLGLNQPETFR